MAPVNRKPPTSETPAEPLTKDGKPADPTIVDTPVVGQYVKPQPKPRTQNARKSHAVGAAPVVVRTGIASRQSQTPTIITCPTCHKENTIHFGRGCGYCSQCGTALPNITASLSVFDNVALGFLKFVGLPQGNPEQMAEILNKLGRIITGVTNKLDGFAKIMGDKALIAIGLSQETQPKTNAEKLLRAYKKIEAALDQLNQNNGTHIYLQAGAHVGKVMAGVIGITGHKGADVLGSPLIYAARILGVLTSEVHQTSLWVSERFVSVLETADIFGQKLLRELNGFDGVQRVREVLLDRYFPPRQGDSTQIQSTQICQLPHATPFCPHCGNVHSQGMTLQSSAQNRTVIILSIDMAGFTRNAAHMQPLEISNWVGEFYREVELIVAQNNGTVIQRNADEVVVRFGISSKGYPEREALIAAQALKEALTRQQMAPQTKSIRFRIGLARGDAFVQGLTTVGNVIEDAQKIQALAATNTIALSSELAVDPHFFETEKRDEIIELTGVNSEAIRRADEIANNLPLVGRSTQLGEVAAEFARLGQEARTVFLQGPHGAGKQAVIGKFLSDHQAEVTTLVGGITPWLHDPLKAALRNEFLQRNLQGSTWNKLLTFVESLPPIIKIPPEFDNSASYTAAILGRYMGMQISDVECPGLAMLRADPEAMERSTRAVVAHYLKYLAHDKPLVLVLEHFDQADNDALTFFKSILSELIHTRLLILATVAPETSPERFNLPTPRTTTFPNFDFDQTAELVNYLILDHQFNDSQLSPASVDRRLVEQIYTQTAGLPLFIIELMKSYLQNEDIFHNPITNNWELKDGVQAGASIEDLFDARLDHLSENNVSAHRLLRSAAVAAATSGGAISRAYLVASINDTQETENFANDLRTLIQGGFLRSRPSLAGDNEYLFTPQALALRAYQTMTDADKKLIHGRIYDFIFSNMQANVSDLETLHLAALHARGAGRYPQAAAHLHKAIEYAKEFNLHSEALGFIEQGREIVQNLSPERQAQFLFDWGLTAFDIHLLRAQKDEAGRALTELEKLAPFITDPAAQLKFLSHQILFYKYFPSPDKDNEWLRAIATQAQTYLALVDAFTAATWHNELGYGYVNRRLLEEAKESFLKAGQEASKVENIFQKNNLLARHFHGLAIYYGESEQLTPAIEMALESLRLFEELGLKKKIAEAHMVLSAYYLNAKNFSQSIHHAQQSIEIAKSIEFVMPVVYSNLNWAEALGAQGEFGVATERATEALAYARTSDLPEGIISALICKAAFTAHLSPREAIDMANEAIKIDKGLNTQGTHIASAHFVLGLAHIYEGNFSEAQGEIERSLAVKMKIFQDELSQLVSYRTPTAALLRLIPKKSRMDFFRQMYPPPSLAQKFVRDAVDPLHSFRTNMRSRSQVKPYGFNPRGVRSYSK